MKKCKKCKKLFSPSKGLINYCSLQCRNSRVWDENHKLKVSESLKKFIKKNGHLSKIDKKTFLEAIEKSKKTWNDKLLKLDFNSLKPDSIRKRVILEQNNKCFKCKLNSWMGEKLTLELEHKDGNSKNNARENLVALCPNCHSLTSTWRGRNKKGRKTKLKEMDYLNSFIKNGNIHKALDELGLAPKGGNYGTMKKILNKYGVLDFIN